LKDSLKKV